MKENGYTIERGFASGWDKDFAHPTQAWTLPKSQTDEFEEHVAWTTLEEVIGNVLFRTEQPIMLKYLIGCMSGVNWSAVVDITRYTISRHFHENNVTGTARTALWSSLEARGLDMVVNPDNGIDLTTMASPDNPLGDDYRLLY